MFKFKDKNVWNMKRNDVSGKTNLALFWTSTKQVYIYIYVIELYSYTHIIARSTLWKTNWYEFVRFSYVKVYLILVNINWSKRLKRANVFKLVILIVIYKSNPWTNCAAYLAWSFFSACAAAKFADFSSPHQP